MANLVLPQTKLPFAARPFRVLENAKPPVLFKAGGFFCCEIDVEKKLPPALQALSDYFIGQMNADSKRLPIIIATDGTDTSQKHFERIRDHFIAQGIDVYSPFSKIDKEFPMTLGILSYYTKNFAQLKEPEKHCAAGLLITVGQNPWGTVGLRMIKPNGAMADSEIIKQLNELVEHPKYLQTNSLKPGKHYPYHFRAKYHEFIQKVLSFNIIGKTHREVFHDALGGATGYFFHNLIYPAIKQIYYIRNAFINRKSVDTIKEGPYLNNQNLKGLKSKMEEGRFHTKVGFVNDIEGGITRVINNDNKSIPASDTILLLLYHFVVNKQRVGKIIKTHDTSSSIDELALKFGLPITEVPSGFKHVSRLVDKSKDPILLAADGKGGLTGLDYLPIKDALFTNTAVLEALGVENVSITTALEQVKQNLLFRYTTHQYEVDADFNGQQKVMAQFKKLALNQQKLWGLKINAARTLKHNRDMAKYYDYQNEYKIFFDDGSWIVAKLQNEGRVILTIETKTMHKPNGWFTRCPFEKDHNNFVEKLKERLNENQYPSIKIIKVNE